VQDALGSFAAKRAYLGAELAARLGVRSWLSETHIFAGLWSTEVVGSMRRHRSSLEALSPDPASEVFARWWSGESAVEGRHVGVILLNPVTRRAGTARWTTMQRALDTRSRHSSYSAAARAIDVGALGGAQ
jgi:hypothetical protein